MEIKNYDKIKDKVTILVNSCDNYDDLWLPFFTLLRQYWVPLNVRVILNTETKTYSMDGMNIEAVHPENPNDSYGKRMLNVLSKIKTPYVIPLLDDFFLRKNVDVDMISNIIDWMEADENIVYFNCDYTPVYEDWDKDKYPGFHRIPFGNVYTLNMQAAVWRTEKLIHYWKPDVSPWEWEEYTNLTAARNTKEKFYCVSEYGNGFCDYGYTLKGMGVHHGKWVKDDVIPLFEKENIKADFSKRGFLEYNNSTANQEYLKEHLKRVKGSSDLVNRCLDGKDKFLYYIFVKRNKIVAQFKCMPEYLYIRYSLLKNRRKFYKKKSNAQRKALIKQYGLFGSLWRKTKK